MKAILLRTLRSSVAKFLAAIVLTFALVVALIPKPHLLDRNSFSPCYVDRNGRLLRLGLADDDRYRVFVPLDKISPQFVEMTLLHEDRYFHDHAGFNPIALLRAGWSDARGEGRLLGASTITMQLARLHYHLNTRTFLGKLCQIAAAIHLECHCSKREILEAYLNLAPYGRNIEGVGAASLIYFGKEPADLSSVEAMTLAVIPQSPARRTPGTPAHELALRTAREILLGQWLAEHPGDERLRGVLAMPLEMKLPRNLPFRAPHLVQEMEWRQQTPRAETRLAIDLDLQDLLERQMTQYLATRATDGFKNASALLIDYQTMEVRAAVGSADFRRKDIDGQVDGLRAQRSPGSALKPFIYGLALDEGLIQPNTLLKDAPESFDGYDPENFDHHFAGPIRATDALIQSRNVPAVDLESRLDPQRNLYTLLRDAGIRRLQPGPHYGLTIALGSAEVSPEEMGALYAMLANRGQLCGLRFALDDPASAAAPGLLSPEAAWLTLNMLKDAPRPGDPNLPRLVGEARPVAWKTGTSFSFRDAWTAGVFDHYVLVVWVGNFDGVSNPEFVGRTAAAPLFFHMVDALRAREPAPARTCFMLDPALNLQQVDLCAVSGMIAGPNCPHTVKGWFIPGKSPIAACNVHRRIWIDNATGLRLDTAPDNPSTAHAEVCEFWPSDLEKLFRAAGVPRAAPPPFAASASPHPLSAGANSDGPSIVSPKKGVTYHVRIGATADDVLDLEATAPTAGERLRWFVDAAYLGDSAPSTALLWKAQPGRHVIRAVDEGGHADTREVLVTAVE
jgi:penicillin-binding protein 1C